MFPYDHFPESFPHQFVDYLIANQIEGIRIIDDEGTPTVYFPMGQDDLTMLLNDWQTPIVNGRRYFASLDQTPIPYGNPKLQEWLSHDPSAVITLPDGRVAIDYKIASEWGRQNAASGDMVQKFLNGPGPVFALITLGLQITAIPALFPSAPAAYLDTFDLLPDPTIMYQPLSSPIVDAPLIDASEAFSPSYPMPEPAPPPAPVAPGEYVPFEEGYPVETGSPNYTPFEEGYPAPAPSQSTLSPSITTPQASIPGKLPSLSLPALSDLPKLIAATAGAGLALTQAQNKADLQKALLSSPAYLPQNSLLYPGLDNPYLNPLAPSTGFGQTLSNLAQSPIFWALVAGIGLVAVTRK